MKTNANAPDSGAAILGGAIAVAIGMSLAAGPAAADGRDHRRGAERGQQQGRQVQIHRPVQRYQPHDRHESERWRAGRWQHGQHAGRNGWWWIAGGVWHHYADAVYPYPSAYAAPLTAARPVPPAAQYWYYCANPSGYYPIVPACRIDWQRVPASIPPGFAR